MHGVGRHFVWVEVEHLGEDFEGETRGQAVHAFIDTRRIAILLDRFGFRVGILEVFAIVDTHLGVDVGVFWLLET
ncbi:hypothetical protein D3C81_2258490 [compost metagenome]